MKKRVLYFVLFSSVLNHFGHSSALARTFTRFKTCVEIPKGERPPQYYDSSIIVDGNCGPQFGLCVMFAKCTIESNRRSYPVVRTTEKNQTLVCPAIDLARGLCPPPEECFPRGNFPLLSSPVEYGSDFSPLFSIPHDTSRGKINLEGEEYKIEYRGEKRKWIWEIDPKKSCTIDGEPQSFCLGEVNLLQDVTSKDGSRIDYDVPVAASFVACRKKKSTEMCPSAEKCGKSPTVIYAAKGFDDRHPRKNKGKPGGKRAD